MRACVDGTLTQISMQAENGRARDVSSGANRRGCTVLITLKRSVGNVDLVFLDCFLVQGVFDPTTAVSRFAFCRFSGVSARGDLRVAENSKVVRFDYMAAE